MRGRANPARRLPRSALLAATLVLVAGCATAPPHGEVDPGFPSPLAGPGAPELAKHEATRLEEAWGDLRAGDPSSALQAVSKAPVSPTSQLLRVQSILVEGEGGAVEELRTLTATNPGYAAAWLTLSVAAERDEDEALALAAAQKGAELWPRTAWQERVERLHNRWVEERVTDAVRLVENGQPETALSLVERALSLEPADRDATLVRARALVALGRSDQAELALASLDYDPDAILLFGAIAEQRRDWERAMNLYQSLPERHPQRESALRRAKLRWRQGNLAPCAQQALASTRLTRAELATVLVALSPTLEVLDSGVSPVLSDIVELPCYREILTAVRHELLTGDPLEHRFFPARPVSLDEIRGAVEGLCHVLDLEAPLWCEGDVADAECVLLTEPVSGNTVAELVFRLSEGEKR